MIDFAAKQEFVSKYKNHKHFKTALAAASNITFDPESRAARECQGYDQDTSYIRENAQFLKKSAQDFIERYEKLFLAYLAAESRTASSMITGPANFPAERNRKRMDTARKRSKEILDFMDKLKKWVNSAKKLAKTPEVLRPIKSDDPDAIEKLRQKIEYLKNKHKQTKAARASYKKSYNQALKNITKELQKLDSRININWTNFIQPIPNFKKHECTLENNLRLSNELSDLRDMLKDYTKEDKFEKIKTLGCVWLKFAETTILGDLFKQFPEIDSNFNVHYVLPYLNQEIKRNYDRLKEIENRNARAESQPEESYEGFKVKRNAENNRLQLFFDQKPDQDTRNLLKRNGFKWAPSQGAWQRILSASAEASLRYFIAALGKVKSQNNDFIH